MNIILFYFLLFVHWVEKAGDFSLTQIKGLSLMNLTIYLLLLFLSLKGALRRKLWEPNNINKSLLMLVLVFAISIPIKIMLGEVQNIRISQEIIIFKNLCEPFLFFFIIFNLLETEEDCQKAIRGLLILLVLTVLTMFLVTYGIMEFGRLKVLSGTYSAGRSSGFGNPNDYASYLILFLPLLLFSLLFQETLFKRVGSVLLLLMTLIGLIATGSRGGILSFLLSLMVGLAFLNREKMIGARAIIFSVPMLILLGIASYSLAPSQVKSTLEEKLDPNFKEGSIEGYTSGRAIFLRNGLIFFIESPIYGHGQNTFLPLQEQRFGISAVAHNRYLSYMVEYGIIGLIIFIMILIKIYRHVWFHIRTTTEFRKRIFHISYIVGFCGYTFSLIAINASISLYLFWIYTAIIYKYSQIGDQKE